VPVTLRRACQGAGLACPGAGVPVTRRRACRGAGGARDPAQGVPRRRGCPGAGRACPRAGVPVTRRRACQGAGGARAQGWRAPCPVPRAPAPGRGGLRLHPRPPREDRADPGQMSPWRALRGIPTALGPWTDLSGTGFHAHPSSRVPTAGGV